MRASEELREQSRAILEGKEYPPKLFPHQIAFNCIPQIPQSDAFLDNGYTSEEMKMVDETRKILGDDSIMVSPIRSKDASSGMTLHPCRPVQAALARPPNYPYRL